MKSISTHVLDISRGRPAAAVPVLLELCEGNNTWRVVGDGQTDADGRLKELVAEGKLGVADDELLWRAVRSADGGALGWVGVVPGDATVNRTTLDALLTLAAELAAMDLARGREHGRRS